MLAHFNKKQITIDCDFDCIGRMGCTLASHNSPADTVAVDILAPACYCRCSLTDGVRCWTEVLPEHWLAVALFAEDMAPNCRCIDRDKHNSHFAANRRRECVRWTSIGLRSAIQCIVRERKCRKTCSRSDDSRTSCHRRDQRNSEMKIRPKMSVETGNRESESVEFIPVFDIGHGFRHHHRRRHHRSVFCTAHSAPSHSSWLARWRAVLGRIEFDTRNQRGIWKMTCNYSRNSETNIHPSRMSISDAFVLAAERGNKSTKMRKKEIISLFLRTNDAERNIPYWFHSPVDYCYHFAPLEVHESGAQRCCCCCRCHLAKSKSIFPEKQQKNISIGFSTLFAHGMLPQHLIQSNRMQQKVHAPRNIHRIPFRPGSAMWLMCHFRRIYNTACHQFRADIKWHFGCRILMGSGDLEPPRRVLLIVAFVVWPQRPNQSPMR